MKTCNMCFSEKACLRTTASYALSFASALRSAVATSHLTTNAWMCRSMQMGPLRSRGRRTGADF